MPFKAMVFHQPLNIVPGDNIFLTSLDGQRCTTKKMLLEEMSRCFRFPAYVGHNYDALNDAMTDLEWLGVDYIYVCMTHTALICSEAEDESDAEVFVEILKNCTRYFKKHPIHFCIMADAPFLKRLNPIH